MRGKGQRVEMACARNHTKAGVLHMYRRRRITAALLLVVLLVAALTAATAGCGKEQEPVDDVKEGGYWKGGAQPGKGGVPAPPPGMEPGMKKQGSNGGPQTKKGLPPG